MKDSEVNLCCHDQAIKHRIIIFDKSPCPHYDCLIHHILNLPYYAWEGKLKFSKKIWRFFILTCYDDLIATFCNLQTTPRGAPLWLRWKIWNWGRTTYFIDYIDFHIWQMKHRLWQKVFNGWFDDVQIRKFSLFSFFYHKISS